MAIALPTRLDTLLGAGVLQGAMSGKLPIASWIEPRGSLHLGASWRVTVTAQTAHASKKGRAATRPLFFAVPWLGPRWQGLGFFHPSKSATIAAWHLGSAMFDDRCLRW
jgi:hypothetical protein